jgi:hypothetical protein
MLFFLGTGIGGGVVIDGKPVSARSAPLAKWAIRSYSLTGLCSCGNSCLDLASGPPSAPRACPFAVAWRRSSTILDGNFPKTPVKWRQRPKRATKVREAIVRAAGISESGSRTR